MVGAGFAASVAPLGTALTETSSRCCGRWRTSRSCASTATAPGRRRRTAPPISRCRSSAGKSLRFALLPEGQDPDDLARSGGRARSRKSSRRRGARRHDLVARDRGRQLRHPGAARGAGGADRRADGRHPRRGGAALLSPGSGRAAAAEFAPEAGRGGYGRGGCRGRRQFRREGPISRRRLHPARAAGRFASRPQGASAGAGRRAGPTRRRAPSSR